MIKAAIDIGTNTAHLIIGKVSDDHNSFEQILTKRFYIFLAVQDITYIPDEARDRLMTALSVFYDLIEQHHVLSVNIVGTEALRKALNGRDIVNHIKDKWNWKVNIISGISEARYIYHGVRQAIQLNNHPHLIMDIGGGSVEWILTGPKGIHWSTSLPIGIAKLYNLFQKMDPIQIEEIEKIDDYLCRFHTDLFKRVKVLKTIPRLIGSAGSFEVFSSTTNKNNALLPHFEVRTASFEEYYKKVIPMDLKTRQNCKWIPKSRATYIVTALVLIRHVLHHLPSDSFLVSRYALKEGMLIV